jgi:hypothetical protein
MLNTHAKQATRDRGGVQANTIKARKYSLLDNFAKRNYLWQRETILDLL